MFVYTVMTPNNHCWLCVAFVLLVAVLVDSATPESSVGHNEKSIKIQTASPDSADIVVGNGKGPASQSSLQFNCKEEDTDCNADKFGYEAIFQLHRLIDDDHNGNVDQSESDEFLRDELQYTDGFERHSLFHNNDKLISVDDLWHAWKFSEVYNWTVDDVIDWLQKEVDLPQYSTIFLENSVSGPSLPRLASSNTFISKILGIKNPVHKQKLALKSMDTVLFGAPPRRHNYIKDLALVASLIFAAGGCWFAFLHHRYSQEQVRKMMIDLESLQKAEEALMDVQRKLQDAENRQISAVPHPPADFKEGTAVPYADLPVVHEGGGEGTRQIKEELAATLLALQHAETQLENSWAPPGELQAWLQLTHELEQLHYNAKRQAAERQFQAAKEVCEKIKRRNKAFFGSLRMAHSNSLDEIDQRILDARVALEEVKQDLQERLHRWHTIERLCGFPVISNPGLATLRLLLHGSREGNGRIPGTVSGALSVDEADEDMPPTAFQCHLPNGLSRQRALTTEAENLAALPYALFPDIMHVEKERQASHKKRGTLRRPPRLSFMSQNMASKSFIRHRATMGSTGSLSHVARTAVTMNAAYNTPQTYHGISSVHRSSLDTDSSSPTTSSLTSPVSFHLGDQVADHSGSLNYTNQSSGGSYSHSRNTHNIQSVNPTPASIHSAGHQGYTGTSQGGTTYVTAQTQSCPATMDESDDNLSQTTMESLPRSQSSTAVREHLHFNNGLDLISHNQSMSSSSDILVPSRLEKKPSRRKKLLNMFKKNPKQKPS